MAISIRKYVDVTSGVGGGAVVRQRDLIGRIFTDNARVPVGSLVEVTSAADAATYFGSTSAEALRAAFYFSYVSPLITSPQRLGFAAAPLTARPPRLFGGTPIASLAGFQAITAGSLTVRFGPTDTTLLNGINLSSATTLAGVAALIQTAIRTNATSAQAPAATVTYDAVSQTFTLTGGVAQSSAVSVDAGTLATALGWTAADAIASPGSAVQSITDLLGASASATNNFGSFLFIPVLTDAQVIEAATWNAARNVEFIYCARTLTTEAVARSAALFGFAGTCLTLTDGVQYDEMVPMCILAATDYTRRNASQNYMYRQVPGLTAKVTSRTNSDAYDAMRVNYYGVTQTAGQQISFYQRGLMMGGATAPLDINVYANEMWLKDQAAAALMSLLLTVGRVPANAEGRAQVMAILQNAINAALRNGIISVGKTLTLTQQLYITSISGDPDARYQVEAVGYWLDCQIAPIVTTDGRTEYKAVYTLIYGKDDQIRKVEGTHVLI